MTNDEYIEGLARAYCIARGINPDEYSPLCQGARWELEVEGMQAIADYHREHGLRVVPYEPTDKMISAGFKVYTTTVLLHEGVKWGYQAMLDAAKKDGYEAMMNTDAAKGESDE